MKHIAILSFSLTVLYVTTGFAGTREVCASGLCALDRTSGYYVGIRGLDAKPSESGLGQVTDSWQYLNSDGSITARSKPARPDYHWNFGFQLGYHLPCTANTLEFNYLNLTNDKHVVNTTGDGPISFAGIYFPDVVIPTPPGFSFVSNAHLRYHLTQVDLRLARTYVDATGHFEIRPAIGVRAARLKHIVFFAVPGFVASKYQGIGPLVGVDMRWGLWNGFGVVGRFDSALLIGKVNAHSNLFNTLHYRSPKTDRIVPNINAKIGVDFNYMFCNHSAMNIELGYEANSYINSFDMIRGDTGVLLGSPKIVGLESTTFSYQGPYLSLSYHF